MKYLIGAIVGVVEVSVFIFSVGFMANAGGDYVRGMVLGFALVTFVLVCIGIVNAP